MDKMLFLALMQDSADFVGSRNTRAPLFFKLCLNSFSFLFEKPKYKTFFLTCFGFILLLYRIVKLQSNRLLAGN